MSILGLIIVILLCLVLMIALFFEVRSLIKSVRQYKKKKQENQNQTIDNKVEK